MKANVIIDTSDYKTYLGFPHLHISYDLAYITDSEREHIGIGISRVSCESQHFVVNNHSD